MWTSVVQNSDTLIYMWSLYFRLELTEQCMTFKDIFQDFPGSGIFKKKPGLSRRRGNPVMPTQKQDKTHKIHRPEVLGKNWHVTDRMVLSELPDTTRESRYWRHAMPRLCPLSVRTNSHVDMSQTLIVRSPDADTMYRRSKSMTLTAARCPTSIRRRLISDAECMSQTATDRSYTSQWVSE